MIKNDSNSQVRIANTTTANNLSIQGNSKIDLDTQTKISQLHKQVEDIQRKKYIELTPFTNALIVALVGLLGIVWFSFSGQLEANTADIKTLIKSEKYHELDKRLAILESSKIDNRQSHR